MPELYLGQVEALLEDSIWLESAARGKAGEVEVCGGLLLRRVRGALPCTLKICHLQPCCGIRSMAIFLFSHRR